MPTLQQLEAYAVKPHLMRGKTSCMAHSPLKTLIYSATHAFNFVLLHNFSNKLSDDCVS